MPQYNTISSLLSAAGTRNRSFLLGQSLNTAVTFNPHCYRSVGEEFSTALKNRSVELTGNLQAFQNKNQNNLNKENSERTKVSEIAFELSHYEAYQEQQNLLMQNGYLKDQTDQFYISYHQTDNRTFLIQANDGLMFRPPSEQVRTYEMFTYLKMKKDFDNENFAKPDGSSSLDIYNINVRAPVRFDNSIVGRQHAVSYGLGQLRVGGAPPDIIFKSNGNEQKKV